MRFLPLIWAELWRKPVEAILTWLAVTVAFTLFGTMAGMNATYHHAIDVARMDRLYVTPRFPTLNGFTFPVGVSGQLERIEGVAGVGAFRSVFGYRGDPHNRVFLYIVSEGMRQGWSELPVSPAQWDRLHATPMGLLISRKAANIWNLKAGDSFSVICPQIRADGAPNWVFRIVDVVEGEDPEWATFGFIIGNFRSFDSALRPEDQGFVNGFRLAVSDSDRAYEIAGRIDRTFANSGTPTLSIPAKANAQDLANSGIAIASMSWIVAGAGLFMILFLTANGMAQSVRERIPEFAVLETVGFRDVNVMALVFIEALIPCVTGAIFGTLLAVALTRWPMKLIPRNLANLPPPTFSATVLFWAIGFAVVLACAGSVVPALRLRRLSVVDALAGR